MNSLPVLLKNPKILLIGAGNVGLQKARVLSKNNIFFCTVSKKFHSDFDNISCEKSISTFEDEHISHFKIIIDATGCKAVKKRLLKLKEKKNFLLNVVDDPDVCDFYFSALVLRGKLKVAISSDGASPSIAKAVRDEIDSMLPDSLESLLKEKSILRKQGIVDAEKNSNEAINKIRRVSLIGCGLGDPDLLTVAVCKEIQRAEIVLYDHLVTAEIVELANPDAKFLFVGKKKGKHSISQEKINQLLSRYFRKGKRVIRLKSGDPFVFGRGAEEALYLQKENIPYQIFNGLSSCIAGPALAGIPLTARGHSAGFSVVSAHLKNNKIYLDWVHLLKLTNHTVVVLMGLSLAKKIKVVALQNNICPDKSVAIVSNASRQNQKVVFTTIEHLDTEAKKVKSPAILIFGGGVDFALQYNFSPYI